MADGKSEAIIEMPLNQYYFLNSVAQKLNEKKEQYGPTMEVKAL